MTRNIYQADMMKEEKQKKVIWTYFPVTLITVLFCCTLWGSSPSAIKIAYEAFRISPDDTASRILLAGVRFFIAGAMTIFFGSLIQRRILLPRRRSVRNIGILALFQTVGQYYFFFMSLAHISGVRGSIINASGNFLAIFFAALVFRMEKLTWKKAAGCIIGFAGIILILGGLKALMEGGAITFEGEGAMLTADVFSAAASCFIKIFSKDEDPVVLCGWQFLVGGSFLALIGLLMNGRLVFYNSTCVIDLIYMGFLSAGAYTLWSILLKYNPVSRIAILGFLNPVMSVFLSALILGENQEAFSLRGLLALALVSLGIIIVNYTEK